ncbi:Phosphoribosylanthranilate isomerase [Methanocella conradii HZ254]|uniref:N-(5'-phosphoribosyl)anthranilate isomerase n=1 Tax=Methanocella conradii (strain DSM 24694 / JCM 17849 / CGMCC 1.5162 / HZ254) TaxID=1041930 RepID=H8IA81_METCZ|nr:phosphoribosylanthranilate isomerase [Methanocella conradii]AFC99147.1 Phosphoribosylanthranilate isomerase [Methanocella conradii HZ254]
MIKVKICGVRTVDDALKCVECGADAVGMLLAPSPRRIPIERARDIEKSLPPFVTSVIVLMPATVEEAIEAVHEIGPDAIQLQGDESPEMLEEMRREIPGVRLIKAVHVGSGGEVEKARMYEGVADAILLDTMSPNRGGSGKTHDWAVSAKVVDSIRKPVVLAGGLRPENVAEAVRMVRPYAVDVASGVESPGLVKDVELMREFIRNAKEALDGR